MDIYNLNCGRKSLGGKILGKGSLKSFQTKISKLSLPLHFLRNCFRNLWQRKNLSILPLSILASVVLGANLKERMVSFSFLETPVYSQEEVESFISMVSPYTPILTEEPSLVAANLAIDSSAIFSEEFLEKPEIVLTTPAKEERAAEEKQEEQRRQIITYNVSASETISGIAKKFGLSVKTLADVNNLSSIHQIKEGQVLLIPPADGVIYTVSEGDTVSAIVKKYQGNLQETLKYTSENIKPGQKIVIVGGRTPESQPVQPRTTQLASARSSRNVVVREESGGRSLDRAGTRSNGYPWGWCTWYAAYRRRVPVNWGNAGRWLASARASGYATGSQPRVGAIIVTNESWAGHVGYVESVQGNSVTISEMNYNGFGVISRRTISRYNPVIKGYIY